MESLPLTLEPYSKSSEEVEIAGRPIRVKPPLFGRPLQFPHNQELTGSGYLSDACDFMSSEHANDIFRYDRTWAEIEDMLDRAERKMNFHETQSHLADTQNDKVYHIRNFKALQGVSKALRWVLGDFRIDDPLE